MKLKHIFKTLKKQFKRSKLYRVNKRDLFNGLLLAALSSVLYFIQQSADRGEWLPDWKGMAMSAISGACGYLLKNFFTPETNPAADEK
jgi:hypothetical protein